MKSFFLSLLVTVIGISTGLDKLVAQDHHLDPESLLCPNLILDVPRASVHFGERSHNPPTSSLTFRLRNTQSLPPISDNPYYPSYSNRNDILIHSIPYSLSGYLFSTHLSYQIDITERLIRGSIRNGLEKLRETLQNYYEQPWWQGTVINTDGESVTIQSNLRESFIRGDIFHIFPTHNNPCSPTYNPNDTPVAIARAVLIDQDEHTSTLQITGLLNSKNIDLVQAGNLVKLSGGNIYNNGNRNYEYDYERSTKRLFNLGFIESSFVDFFAADSSRYPVDITYVISETILTEANDFGFIIHR